MFYAIHIPGKGYGPVDFDSEYDLQRVAEDNPDLIYFEIPDDRWENVYARITKDVWRGIEEDSEIPIIRFELELERDGEELVKSTHVITEEELSMVKYPNEVYKFIMNRLVKRVDTAPRIKK